MPSKCCRGCGPHLAEPALQLFALAGMPPVAAGDDLPSLTWAALSKARVALQGGDVLVFAQKIISKAEGRRVDLSTVLASPRAQQLAQQVRKDPRLVELVL